MKKTFTIILLLFAITAGAQNTTPESGWWITDGAVRAIAKSGNTVYMGGSFGYVGPVEPYGALINITTGAPDFTFANPNGIVNAAISDGAGGWVIGGAFTEIGGQT